VGNFSKYPFLSNMMCLFILVPIKTIHRPVDWGKWGERYNSKEYFLIFFDFLKVLTDQLYHASEPYNTYLEVLHEKGS
jgi:hypothetical protein